MGYLSLLSGVLGVLVKLYDAFWSDSAVLARLKLKLSEVQGRQNVEAARLKSEYDRIHAQPDKTGQALLDSLNRRKP